jgi:hypothetical protein
MWHCVGKSAAVLSVCLVIPAASYAETLLCTVKPTSPRIDRVPTKLTAEIDPTRSFVLVTDNVGGRPSAHPVRAEVTRDDGQRFMFKWELTGLKRSNVRDGSLAFGHSAKYRATYNSSGDLVLTAQTNPWKPPLRTTGRCQRASS